MPLAPNLGECPPHAKGKRIRGFLRNGARFGFEPVSSSAPAGWLADTTDWRLSGSPVDVLQFEVI